MQENTYRYRIPWMDEPGSLQSTGSQRVGHDWATSLSIPRFAKVLLMPLLFYEKWKWKSLSCVWLFGTPMDYTVHEILQARILEWVAFPFSRGPSQPRDWTQVSHTAARFFTSWATKSYVNIHFWNPRLFQLMKGFIGSLCLNNGGNLRMAFKIIC